ncbi:hypothetical protein C0Q70_14093 [Pomacea canaliculata]|uniref:2'-phosphotransferase n=1 Tax=Pomacea canaliculata TaxID=400727 RepID=A0A2T7NZ16_POMCA|nr:hypothetical protein C0Q70_14093 [Pomacea canaliculata]
MVQESQRINHYSGKERADEKPDQPLTHSAFNGGFLFIDDILRKPKFKRFTTEDIVDVVNTNDKQRFHLETDSITGQLKIRANQGHSLVVPDLELKPITSAEQYSSVIHGTYYKFWESIKRQGLKRMTRTHIHFAAGEPGESGIISGMRNSCDLMIYLDLEKALLSGLQFFLSSNNVILSSGDENGVIAPIFFQKVVDRKTGQNLLQDIAFLDETGKNHYQKVLAESELVLADDLADEVSRQRKARRKKGHESGKR